MAIRSGVENLPPAGELIPLFIVVVALLGIIARPWRSRAWQWSLGAAALVELLPFRASPGAVWTAWWNARDVAFFLLGILTIADVSAKARLFEVAAERLLALSGGRRLALLAWLFGLGTLSTAVLSNDTTVIALTPAVLVLAAALRERAAPYAYACALVANAGSFVLPIANPANLLLYGAALPPLLGWLRVFALPSIAALAITFVVLAWLFRRELGGGFERSLQVEALRPGERAVLWAVLFAVALLLAASLFQRPPGLAALLGAAVVLGTGLLTGTFGREDLRRIDLGVLPFVAGLLVLLAAIEATGLLAGLRVLLQAPGAGHSAVAVGFLGAVASALANNLPIAALAASLSSAGAAAGVHRALVIAIDLGPNFALSGSLATLLWAQMLRKHGMRASAREFARIGIACTLPALAAALLLARF